MRDGAFADWPDRSVGKTGMGKRGKEYVYDFNYRTLLQ